MANAYNNHIPEELLEKILLPQPVKSLGQCKCVCKSWNQLISRKSFIKAYGAHQKTSKISHRYFLLNYRDPYPYPNPNFNGAAQYYLPYFGQYEQGYRRSRYSACNSYYSASLVDRKSYNVLKSDNDIFFRERTEHCLEVYGICDGLLCRSVHDNMLHRNPPIYLYNPIIRKGKKLIPPIPDPTPGFYPGEGYISICFGYHDDDYKVIRVNFIGHMYEVHIYSLNTDNWKFIEIEDVAGTSTGKCTFDVWPYPKTKLVKGVAYFVQGHGVVSFDLSCEIILKMQLPGKINSVDHIIMEEYGDSIALIGSTNSHNSNTGNGVVMWELRQSENSYTWEEKFNLEAGRNNEYPEFYQMVNCPAVQAMGGFLDNNDLVMRRWTRHHYYGYISREYFLYNVENGSEQQFQTPEERTGERAFLQRMYILTESLVLHNETTMPPIPSHDMVRFDCSSYNKINFIPYSWYP